MSERIRVELSPSEHVTAIVYPATPADLYSVRLILAHGAGSNQLSSAMTKTASALSTRGTETITFNFLYSEQRKRVPDRNDKLEACWRRVIETTFRDRDQKQLVIGGRSMGGRIASQVAAADASGIAGLVFLGYPLHPPGRPEMRRDKHLFDIRVPMMFIQGEKDVFGTPSELGPILRRPNTELAVIEGADHSLKVPKRASIPQDKVDEFVLDNIEAWLRERIGNQE